jgi:hypothetical protein
LSGGEVYGDSLLMAGIKSNITDGGMFCRKGVRFIAATVSGPITGGVEIKIDCTKGNKNVKLMEDYL